MTAFLGRTLVVLVALIGLPWAGTVAGQTSGELAAKLLTEAIAYGHVELVGENSDGMALYRQTT